MRIADRQDNTVVDGGAASWRLGHIIDGVAETTPGTTALVIGARAPPHHIRGSRTARR